MSENHDVHKRVRELEGWPRPLVVRRGPQFPLALAFHMLVCLVAFVPGAFLVLYGSGAVVLPRVAMAWGQAVPGSITRTYKHGQEYRFVYDCSWNGQAVSGDDSIEYDAWTKLHSGQSGTVLVLGRGRHPWYTRFQLPQTEDVTSLDVISLIFCAMGSPLIALAVYVMWSLLNAPRFLANASAVVGTVRSSGSKWSVYSYSVHGQMYRGVGSAWQRSGDLVLVMYDPKRPKRSTIVSESVYRLEHP